MSHMNHDLGVAMYNLPQNQVPSPAALALWDAAAQGDIHKVKQQLAKSPSVNWYNNLREGKTSLHAACQCSQPDSATIVRMLLDAGAATDVVDLPDYNTPLHLAAGAGDAKSCQLLVERPEGPKLLQRGNAFGNTPLHQAAVMGQIDTVAYLLAQGAVVDAVNKRGSTPLLFTAYNDSVDLSLIALLVDNGADINHADHDGVALLHIAAIKGHKQLVQCVLGRGVSADVPDKNGYTPAAYADLKGYSELAKILHDQG